MILLQSGDDRFPKPANKALSQAHDVSRTFTVAVLATGYTVKDIEPKMTGGSSGTIMACVHKGTRASRVVIIQQTAAGVTVSTFIPNTDIIIKRCLGFLIESAPAFGTEDPRAFFRAFLMGQ